MISDQDNQANTRYQDKKKLKLKIKSFTPKWFFDLVDNKISLILGLESIYMTSKTLVGSINILEKAQQNIKFDQGNKRSWLVKLLREVTPAACSFGLETRAGVTRRSSWSLRPCSSLHKIRAVAIPSSSLVALHSTRLKNAERVSKLAPVWPLYTSLFQSGCIRSLQHLAPIPISPR